MEIIESNTSINILNAVTILSNAREEMTTGNIQHSFRYAGF